MLSVVAYGWMALSAATVTWFCVAIWREYHRPDPLEEFDTPDTVGVFSCDEGDILAAEAQAFLAQVDGR